MVNGQPITREALARFTGAIARERGRIDLDPAEQRRILDRLIDEEVLLQYGIALGLDRSEPSARRAIVSAVVDSLTTESMREPGSRRARGVLPRAGERPSRGPDRCRSSSRWCRSARLPRTRRSARRRDRASRARRGVAHGARGASSARRSIRRCRPARPPTTRCAIASAASSCRRSRGSRRARPVIRCAQWTATGWCASSRASPMSLPPLDDVLEAVRQAWTQQEHDVRLSRRSRAARERVDRDRGSGAGGRLEEAP